MAGSWEKGRHGLKGSPSARKAGLEPRLLPSASGLLHQKIGSPGYCPEDSWGSTCLCTRAGERVCVLPVSPLRPLLGQGASSAAFSGCPPTLRAVGCGLCGLP